MFKTLVLALVLAGASLSFIGNLSAAPVRGDGWQPAQNYMSDRHNPADTNGFSPTVPSVLQDGLLRPASQRPAVFLSAIRDQ